MDAPPPPALLDAAQTRALLPLDRVVAELRRAVIELSRGDIRCPPRSVVGMEEGALLLSMPAVAADLAIHKLISVSPRNRDAGLAVILGSVTVLDPRSGVVRLVLDGPTVTGVRTAAMSMLAATALGPPAIRDVLIVGTGTQARHHVDALAACFPAADVRVRARTPEAGRAFRATRETAIAPEKPGEAFDLVVTCTTSTTPVYRAAARVGTLVIAVGSFQPGAAEIDPATVRDSELHVDDPAGARHEAGDLIQAGIDWRRVRALGDALVDGPRDRTRPQLFKSVGCAAWDLAAARVAIAASRTGG